MAQMILRIAVALVTFVIGLAVSTLLGAVLGLSSGATRYNYVPRESGKRPPCQKFRSMSELPPPPPVIVAPAVPDVPPPPPPPKPVIKKRVSVKLPDGTVRVIESSVETVERKF